MAQTKKEIQSHLETAGSQPRHRFGQNFMIDQNLVRLIAAAGEIAPGDVVIEVGPGTGTLTEELLASPASKVVAVEIDRDLAKMLRDKFAAEPRFNLIEGDALAGKHELNKNLISAANLLPLPSGERAGVRGEPSQDESRSSAEAVGHLASTDPISSVASRTPSTGTPGEGRSYDVLQSTPSASPTLSPHPASPLRGEGQDEGATNSINEANATLPLPPGEGTKPVKLVANLPYNIASPLVIELLIAGVQTLAFTVQKEVADRLAAKAGDDAYGSISVMVQLLGDVEVMRTLPPQAFWPAPKIDSALVRIRRRDRLGSQANAFSKFLQQLFSARRKTLRKALSQADYDANRIIAALSLDPQARPETLDPQTLWAVFQQTC